MAVITGHSEELWEWISRACGLDRKKAQVTKVIIQVSVDDVVRVWIEGFGTDEVFVKTPELTGAEVIIKELPKKVLEDYGPSE